MLKILALAMFAAILQVQQSVAGTDKLKICTGIENDRKRLSCYDEITELKKPNAKKIEPADRGDWNVSESKSQLTDQTTVVASVSSNEDVDCGYGRNGKANLFLRCSENTTVLYLSTQCHLTSSKYSTWGDVDYRIDARKPKKVSMDNSTDNKALGLWNGRRAIPVIKSLVGSDKLTIRFTPYNESPKTVTFATTNIESAIQPIRKACSW